MAWQEGWGHFSNQGASGDVMMVGSPARSIMGFDLTEAKQAGYGKGVNFTANNNAGTNVTIDVNLIGIATQGLRYDNKLRGYASPGGPGQYKTPGWTYSWFADLYYSTDGGRTYTPIERDTLVAKHATPMNLAYKVDSGVQSWKMAHIKWTRDLNLPRNFTHLKLEIKGEDPGKRHQNIYRREQILPPPPPPPPPAEVYIKPWAIRKSGSFKTLTRVSGWFKIRRAVQWSDKSEQNIKAVGMVNQGVAQIRKSGSWKGQNKIGGN